LTGQFANPETRDVVQTQPLREARHMSRILTTHVGSLPRPHALLDAMKARLEGNEPPDYERRVREAVAECVRKQVEAGIDIVSDGEQSKPGFFAYVKERLAGFEPKPDKKVELFPAEVRAFPEYYAQYFKEAMLGGAIARFAPLVCTGPVSYRSIEPLQRDIENLKAAAAAAKVKVAFMPAIAPSGVGTNEYYKTEEQYLHAVGSAMRTEYRAIVDAGLLLQVDDPFLCDVLVDPRLDAKQQRTLAALHVEVINESIKGIPPEKIRFHTCYGINEGPRIHEAPMREVARYMLKVNAGAYSFENANVRHEHEYHIWEEIKLAGGKKLIPGMLLHASNIVEHPELVAERLVRFAQRVGRDNIIAGTDCGFSSQASYRTEVHPTVVWEKFKALSKGARIASRRLWPTKRRGKVGRK
jgi:5-methyltetrahydropteroyltriglutamate--homocysteine methyltransferase